MAGNGKSGQRVEPSFGDFHESGDDLRLDASDRINGTRGGAKKSKPSDPFEPQKRERSRKASPKSAKRSSGGITGFIRSCFYWCIVLGIWGGIGVAGLVLYYGARMPSASTWTIPERPPNLKIVAVDGTVLANRGTTGGEALALEDMSPYLPQAVVAIEDRRFYSHFGIDPLGLARAIFTNITSGRTVQGGSTLTQQLAKNLFLSPDRTLERKIQEVLLAFWLEQKYTKDQILAMYLNRVYFGSNAYGVEAASRRYFNKSARDVNLGEAALLAGLLKAPSRLSPARDPQAAEERAQVVLQSMRDVGFISEDEIKTAMSQPPTKAKRFWSGAEHYAADMVLEEVRMLVGDVKQDLVVDTTIDLDLEKEAEKSLSDVLKSEGKKLGASQAALASIDGTGAIRAIVGGADYTESQFNRASKAKRQPGSAFKPFVYIAALENGLTPNSVRNDAPVKIGKWTPENYDQKYRGEVTLATAIANSLNTIAAQLVMEVGPERVTQVAHRMGIESDLQANASIALGTSEVSLLELTAAYAPMMNGGFKATPHIVKRITDPDGKVLYENKYDNPPRVLSEAIAATMNSMLVGVINEGTGKAARLKGWQAAGKSGTTQSFRDALFVGYTSTLTTGVWFGNDDGTSMKKVTGGGLPAKAWKEFMTAAHAGLTPSPLFGLGTYGAPEIGQPMAEAPPKSIGDIISNALGGGPAPTPQDYPAAPVGPDQTASTSPYPPADIPAQQFPQQNGGPVPPADVGGGAPQRQGAPKQTTLFDVLMGN
ncbi:transglycosylase domain-containing protein [Agrobacterium rosae]|uniref:Penicillin-binding protein n=1 Tax=Agrobacterium rosae TaxID=1972867 RepID=A0AAE5S0T0_9HYPH|nr:transglycosylase domain-containing protein [Agrobacterium rosae]KAA3511102.1 penicillin-binding protein [Agrobacterium rosae]KAA3518140.1 penicillin-binding protein [Agrobacterium rosae]MCM2434445.1 penicillin-binding protein [Agrobacterium rosae]MDX8329287.1 transglycosylase domain-containing protein [Agrobacterium rosae]MQB49727.1 penicillin-binding protein [Agrobacterium rosae]